MDGQTNEHMGQKSLSGDSKIIFKYTRKQSSFIILLLWLGPEIAVKAAIDAFGQSDRSSPILANHSRKDSSVPSLSPLKCTCVKNVHAYTRLCTQYA